MPPRSNVKHTRGLKRRNGSKPGKSTTSQQAQQRAGPLEIRSNLKPPLGSAFKPNLEVLSTSDSNPPPHNSRKRKLSGTHSEVNMDESSPQTFAALKARTRHVPSEVVASKWEVLSEPAQSHLLELFQAVQRPVLMSYGDDKRRGEAQSALAPVVRTLGKRLPRMPFPSNTRDWHFDYERLLEKNRILESLLTPAIHSIELLKSEIEKEEQALYKDRDELAELERNAAFAEKERTRQSNRAHKLLKPSMSEVEDIKATGLAKAVSGSSLSIDTGTEDNLSPLATQLINHLESMQSNTAQVTDVGEALVRTRAAVDDACYRHLSLADYEQISGR